MSDSIIIRNNSHECSTIIHHSNTNLYSAKLLNPCSQSQRVLMNRYLVLFLLLFLYSFSYEYYSFQTVKRNS